MPRLTNSNGKDDRIDFKFGEDTEVHESCSLTWRGEHYVFGGRYESRQISKIIGCELRNIGKYSIQAIFFVNLDMEVMHTAKVLASQLLRKEIVAHIFKDTVY